jgi:hypothetical protein
MLKQIDNKIVVVVVIVGILIIDVKNSRTYKIQVFGIKEYVEIVGSEKCISGTSNKT